MAKGQKRNNRETRKPKQEKKPPAVAKVGLLGSVDPVRAAIAGRRTKG